MCLDSIVCIDPLTGTKHVPAKARVDPSSLPFHPLPQSPVDFPAVKVTLFHLGVIESYRQAWADDIWDENAERRLAKAAQKVSLPVLSALIEHQSSGEKWLWDLGMTNDTSVLPNVYSSGAIGFLKPILNDHGQLHVVLPKTIGADSLEEIGLSGIILSHAHVDHFGNLLKFPIDLPVLVGSGTMEWIGGGDEAAEKGGKGLISFPSSFLRGGRQFFEMDQIIGSSEPKVTQVGARMKPTRVGPFEHGWDFFGDGSLFIMQAQGHCRGHQVLLARTSSGPKPTFVLLGGDAAHQQDLFHPLPPPLRQGVENLVQDVGSDGEESSHGEDYSTEKDYRAVPGFFDRASDKAITDKPIPDAACMQEFPDLAMRTLASLTRMDALDDVMVVLAHEVEFVEATSLKEGESINLNAWKELGIKKKKLEAGKRRREELSRLP